MTDTGGAERLSIRVVETVANEEGVPATDLDCLLADAIDPQALDDLFSDRTGDSATTGSVRFSYCGYAVTVTANGTVTVE